MGPLRNRFRMLNEPSLELPVAIHAAVESAMNEASPPKLKEISVSTPPLTFPGTDCRSPSSQRCQCLSTKAGRISCRRHRPFRDTDFASTLQPIGTRFYRNPRARSQPVRWPQCPLDRCARWLIAQPIGNGSCSPKRPKNKLPDLPTRPAKQDATEIQSLQQQPCRGAEPQSSTEARAKQLPRSPY